MHTCVCMFVFWQFFFITQLLFTCSTVKSCFSNFSFDIFALRVLLAQAMSIYVRSAIKAPLEVEFRLNLSKAKQQTSAPCVSRDSEDKAE